MRKKTIVRFIQIGLEKPEDEIIKKVEESGRQVGAIIRSLIQAYGKEQFPPDPGYVQVAKEKLELRKRTAEEQEAWDKLDPAEYAEKTMRMRVKNGSAWYMIPVGEIGWTHAFSIPLKDIKNYKPEDDRFLNHNMILDKKFERYERPGNKPHIWTPQDCENGIKKFNEMVDQAE